jgi:hypothetical protein
VTVSDAQLPTASAGFDLPETTATVFQAALELHFEGTGKWFHTGTGRAPLEVVPTGTNSCHVTYRDTQDPKNAAAFDLPDTEAAVLHAALELYQPDRWIYASINRYPLRATETGPSSCHVTAQDVQLPAVSAGFELPAASVEVFQQELRRQLQLASTPPVQQPQSASGKRPRQAGPQSPTDKYFQRRLNRRRNWRIAEAAGTTACCGFPCCLVVVVALALVVATLGWFLL